MPNYKPSLDVNDIRMINELMDANLPGNSHKSKEPKPPTPPVPDKPEVTKVIKGEVVKPKKTIGRWMRDILVHADFKQAVGYVATEVLIPSVKNMILEAGHRGLERIVWKDSNPLTRAPQYGRPGYTPYNRGVVNPYVQQQRGFLPGQAQQAAMMISAPVQDLGDIILYTREDAELAIAELAGMMSTYEVASVADFKALVGLVPTYIDEVWGWTSIAYFQISQTRDGWKIHFPPPEQIAR